LPFCAVEGGRCAGILLGGGIAVVLASAEWDATRDMDAPGGRMDEVDGLRDMVVRVGAGGCVNVDNDVGVEAASSELLAVARFVDTRDISAEANFVKRSGASREAVAAVADGNGSARHREAKSVTL
jgi:hypothetical protein